MRLILIHYPNRNVKVSGALTSFINDNNIANLSYSKVCKSIKLLCSDLVKASETLLNGFEIDINIELTYKPEHFFYLLDSGIGLLINTIIS